MVIFNVFVYMFVVLVVIVLAGILGSYIYYDTIELIRYNKAVRVNASVINVDGVFSSVNYGARQPKTLYKSYIVDFVVDDKKCLGTFISKKGLNIGDTVEVRYEIQCDGSVEIVNSDRRDRFIRFIICTVIGILIAVFQIIVMNVA